MKITWIRQVKAVKKDPKEKTNENTLKKANTTSASGLGTVSESKEKEEDE